MEVFILKFQTIADYQIPEIFSRWYVAFVILCLRAYIPHVPIGVVIQILLYLCTLSSLCWVEEKHAFFLPQCSAGIRGWGQSTTHPGEWGRWEEGNFLHYHTHQRWVTRSPCKYCIRKELIRGEWHVAVFMSCVRLSGLLYSLHWINNVHGRLGGKKSQLTSTAFIAD